MISEIVITESGIISDISARKREAILAAVLHDTASRHHQLYMAKHFTVAGAREYGYKPRAGEGKSGKAFWRSYTGKKKRQKGHQRPLVWSGESEMLARIHDIKFNSKRARIVQHARGLNRRNPHSAIHMNEEIKAVSEREVREDIAFAQKTLAQKLAELKSSKLTVRIRA